MRIRRIPFSGKVAQSCANRGYQQNYLYMRYNCYNAVTSEAPNLTLCLAGTGIASVFKS